MLTIRRLPSFDAWLSGLRDDRAVARIAVRIDRIAAGNAGQTRNLSGSVSEMKIDYGPGYRVYYTQRGTEIIVLLCGGDKRTQERDIREALRLAGTI